MGEGNEPEDAFAPTNLDCRQWCRVARAAGPGGLSSQRSTMTDFVLWPSKFFETYGARKQVDGWKGDVLKELSQACREYGLKFGVYLSPWDRNHPNMELPLTTMYL